MEDPSKSLISFEIKDVETLALLAERLGVLGQSHLGTQTLRDIVAAAQLVADLLPVLDRVAQDAQRQIGPRASALKVHEAYQTWKLQVGHLLQLCNGTEDANVSFREMSVSVSEALISVRELLEKCRVAEGESKARAALQRDFHALSELIGDGVLAGWAPLWNTVSSALSEAIESGASAEKGQECLASMVSLWEDSALAGNALIEVYKSAAEWPVQSRAQSESPSSWLLATLRAVSRWVQHEVGRMSKLRPGELPSLPVDLRPALTAPVVQVAFEIEAQLAPLRAKAAGAVATLQWLRMLAEKAKQDGFTIRSEVRECVGHLLTECRLDSDYLTALQESSIILGPETVDVCRRRLSPLLQSMPVYLRTPLFDRQEDGSEGYRVLTDAVSDNTVDVGFALRVWARRADWPAELVEGPSSPVWRRFRELDTVGCWAIVALLDSQIGSETASADLLASYVADVLGSPDGLLPLAGMARLDLTDDSVLALLAAVELVAFRSGLDVEMRGIPTFVQRFADQFPAICDRMRPRIAARFSGAQHRASSGSSAIDPVQEFREQAHRAVRPRNYRGVKCIEQLGRRFVDECAAPFLEKLERARTAREVKEALNGDEAQLQVAHVIDRWAREFPHGPEGQLRQRLISDCQEMVDAVRAFGLRLSESSGPVVSGHTGLEREIDNVRNLGGLGATAADLIADVLLGNPPKLIFPGVTLENRSGLASFPRTLALWNDGDMRLFRYVEAITTDLQGDPLAYALSEAEAGRVGRSVEVLENLGVPQTHAMRLAVEARGREWAELVEMDRQEIASDIGDATDSDRSTQLLQSLCEAVSQRDYADAAELLEDLRAQASEKRKAREDAKKVRDELTRRVEEFVVDVSRTPRTVRSTWTENAQALLDDLAGGAPVEGVQAKLDALKNRLAAGDTPPAPERAGLYEVPAKANQTGVPAPDDQQHDMLTEYAGIVKAVVGTMYGFILPFDEDLREMEDIYFHKNNIRSSVDTPPQLPPAGAVVGFRVLVLGPEYTRPAAMDVWMLSPQEQEAPVNALSEQLGIPLKGVGFVSEGALFTVGQGFHSAQPPDAAFADSLVQFDSEQVGNGKSRVSIVGPYRKSTDLGIEFLRRVARRATAPRRRPSLDMTNLSTSMLRDLVPSRPEAYRDAKALQLSLSTIEEHEQAVAAVEELASLSSEDKVMAWRRAVLVGSYLATSKARREPVQAVLEHLAKATPSWFGSNPDGTFALVYQALHSFAEGNPQELPHEEVYSFFHDIQDRLGAAPHYRLELIQAYISIEDADQDVKNADKVRRAEQHIRRAMVINPRLAEAHDLLRQLRDKFGKRTTVIPVEKVLPGSSLPTDPVLATEFIRYFYDSLGGRADEEKAKRFFANNRQRLQKGIALDTLISQHCRYLLTCDSSAAAEQILLENAQGGCVENWPTFVDLLHDLWLALDLDEFRVEEAIGRIGGTLPVEAQPHLELLLGRILFGKGRYESALRHAGNANAALRSTESRQLLTRCQQVGRSTSSATAEVVVREQVWLEAQTIADEGDNLALAEFVLSHMDDEHVGPWLVLKSVSESGMFTHETERKSLLRRAHSLEATPSVDLLQAEIMVRWGREVAGQVAGLDSTLLSEAVGSSACTVSMLQSIDRALDDAGTSYAVHEALLQIHPSDLAVRWQLAIAAKRLWTTTREPRFIDEYVLSSVPCVRPKDALAPSPAVVANDMLAMNLYGLAAVVAHAGVQAGNRNLTDIKMHAAERAVLAPWEWPSALQRSRVDLEEHRWGTAANHVACALLTNPGHWPTCRAYLKVFTDLPKEEDPIALGAVLDLGIAGVLLAAETDLGKLSPELLVIQAELVLAVGGIDNIPANSDNAARQCYELCSRAQRLRQGFRPAIELQNRLKPDVFLAPGETYAGRYRIVEALLPGSYGQVYRADVLDPRPGEPAVVAMKLVRADAPTPEKREQQRGALAREARVALRLKHQNIVRVFDFIDNRCLVMEYIEGWTLASRIDNRVRIPWRTALKIGLQIALALEYATELAHREFGTGDANAAARAFAHRDIHPGNIMVIDGSEGPQAKLLDFGLARIPGGTATTAVFAGVNRRLIYRAPEYGPRMDYRGDMFALGVVLYELITGEGPYPYDKYCDYQNNQATPEETSTSLRRVSDLISPETKIPEYFDEVLEKMVRFRCQDRHDSWSSLIRELSTVIEQSRDA